MKTVRTVFPKPYSAFHKQVQTYVPVSGVNGTSPNIKIDDISRPIATIKTENNDDGISVCISAWNTAEYIEECLDSVAAQTWFKTHDNWEILLGVDGCEKTLAKVKEIMHKYKNLKVMMMNENVGTYVTCNTIMKEANYEWLMRFDSDDIMNSNMISTLMSKKGDADFVLCKCEDFPTKRKVYIAEGIIFIKKNVFMSYGGFLNRRCGCDTELRVRTKNKIHQKMLGDVLFKRRLHSDSLISSKTYKYGSKYRQDVAKYIREQSPKISKIDFVTTKFKIIINDYIVVSFTSWKKRIQYCSNIVDLMKQQTLKPNKIILNLSTDEFKNKEQDLPENLVKKQDNVFEIFWVKENTKVHKKITPTLERFPNDVIISIDDDIEYPNNFIETLYSYYVKHGKKHPITSGTYKWSNNIYTHYGCFSLFKKDMLYPYYDDLYKNVVLKHGYDKIPFADPIFTYSVLLNGNRYIYTDSLNMSDIREKSINNKKNRVSNVGTAEYKKIMENEHKLLQSYILKKYNKTYDDLTKHSKCNVIVNITTWTKRDWCLPIMLNNLKKQTFKPDKIILWLSEEEYNKNDLPQHISKCLLEGLLTDIMWVKKNTYCHKRFECFKYFNDSYNIFLDDDILYHPNFLKELVNESKKHPNCITVYSTSSIKYENLQAKKEKAIIGESHYNSFMGGRCCFPPNILPNEVFEKTELRDKYVTKCDESWIRPILIKHNIKIYSMHNFDIKDYPIIEKSQNDAVYNENKQIKNGIREKERNFFNAIKIHNCEKECKQLWPNINIDKWKLTL